MHTLLQRKDEELNKRIYNAQKNNPSKGDWIELVHQYFKDLGIPFDKEEIKKETKLEFNSIDDLKSEQNEHSKICNFFVQLF